MTTNLLVTLVWTLATNSTLVGKVRHVQVPLTNPDPSTVLAVIQLTPVTLTHRHDLSSNLIASFSVMGTTQSVQVLSVPVKSWTTTTETHETPWLGNEVGQSYSIPAIGYQGASGGQVVESLSITTP